MQKLESSLAFLRHIQTQFAATPSLFGPVEESIGCTPDTFIRKVNEHVSVLEWEYEEYRGALAGESASDEALRQAERRIQPAYSQLRYSLSAEFYPERARVFPFLFDGINHGHAVFSLRRLLQNIDTNHIQPAGADTLKYLTQARTCLADYDAAYQTAKNMDAALATEANDAKNALPKAYDFVRIVKTVLRTAYRGQKAVLELIFPPVAKPAPAPQPDSTPAQTPASGS